MYLFVQISPRKYVIVESNGHYNVLKGVKVDPEEARSGKITFGPADYDTVCKKFVQWTKIKPEKS